MIKRILLLGVLLLGTVLAKDYPYPRLNDLAADLKHASAHNKAVVLVFVAKDCAFCTALEEQILGPMRASGEYGPQAVVRMVEYDRPTVPVQAPEGQSLIYQDLIERFHIAVTPTVVFLDAKGEEAGEALIGFNGPDFYWAFLDQRIAAARGL